MATVTGLTAARMRAIEAASIADADVVGNNLILIKHDGTEIDAGSVKGPAGPSGPPGVDYQGVWASGTTYAINKWVSYNGSYYWSKQNGNTNHNPSTDTSETWWAAGVPRWAARQASGTVHVVDYNAKGDGVILYNAVMTAGSNVLNSTDVGVNFTSQDIGKLIIVSGVGPSNESLVTTIQSINTISQAVLAAAATVDSPDVATARIAVYGTDDTAAIQAASDAAAAQNGTLVFDGKIYMVGGALHQGGARKTNAQITLPFREFKGGMGRLIWRGARDPGGNPFEPFPTDSGVTILMSTLVGRSYSSTYGVPSVIGSATREQSAGWSGTTFSGHFFGVENLVVLTPRNPSLSAFNLEKVSSNRYRGSVIAGTLEWGYPQTTIGDPLAISEPTHPQAAAFIEPMTGNQNAGSGQHDSLFSWGYFCALVPSEHTVISSLTVQPSKIPIGIRGAVGASPSGYTHHVRIMYAEIQLCPHHISGWDPSAASSAAGVVAVPSPSNPGGNGILIDSIDIEDVQSDSTAFLAWCYNQTHVNDANSQLTGYLRYSRWTYKANVFSSNLGLNVVGGSQFNIRTNTFREEGSVIFRTEKDAATNLNAAMAAGAWTAIDAANWSSTFNSGQRGWVEIEFTLYCLMSGTTPYHLLLGLVDGSGNYITGSGDCTALSMPANMLLRHRYKRFVYLTPSTIVTIRPAFYLPTAGSAATMYWGGSGVSGNTAFPNGKMIFVVRSMGNQQAGTLT